MDFFSHGLWAYLIFRKYEWKYLGLLFAILPDLLFGIPALIYFAFRKSPPYHAFISETSLIYKLYYLFHSPLTMFFCFFISSLFIGRFFYPLLLGWGMHVVIDFLTHQSIAPPRPFYPISSLEVKGLISWGEPWFLALNYSLLIISYTYILITDKLKF